MSEDSQCSSSIKAGCENEGMQKIVFTGQGRERERKSVSAFDITQHILIRKYTNNRGQNGGTYFSCSGLVKE